MVEQPSCSRGLGVQPLLVKRVGPNPYGLKGWGGGVGGPTPFKTILEDWGSSPLEILGEALREQVCVGFRVKTYRSNI